MLLRASLWTALFVATSFGAAFASVAPRGGETPPPAATPIAPIARGLEAVASAIVDEGADRPETDAIDLPRPEGARGIFATTLLEGARIRAYVASGGAEDALDRYRSALVASGFVERAAAPSQGDLRRGRRRVLLTARQVPEGALLTIVDFDHAEAAG